MRQFNFYFKILNYVPIVIVVFFVLILVIGAIFLWPKYKQLDEIKASLEGREAELQNRETYFDNLSDLESKLKEYPEQLSKIDSTLPDGPSLSSLFYFIQQASSQSGLVLSKISPFSTMISQQRPSLKESTFSINLIGPYPAFKSFLSTLEASARMVEVEGISFSFIEDASVFNFKLALKVFSY